MVIEKIECELLKKYKIEEKDILLSPQEVLSEASARYKELFDLQEDFASAMTGNEAEGPDYDAMNEATDSILTALGEIVFFISPTKTYKRGLAEKDWRRLNKEYHFKVKKIDRTFRKAVLAYEQVNLIDFFKHIDTIRVDIEKCIRFVDQKVRDQRGEELKTQKQKIEDWEMWLKNQAVKNVEAKDGGEVVTKDEGKTPLSSLIKRKRKKNIRIKKKGKPILFDLNTQTYERRGEEDGT